MRYKFSKHAIEQIERRGLSTLIIKDIIISNPARIIKYDDCVEVIQKVINDKKSNYLYRVFVNICKTPALIITVYKTSKIDKYENKI